MESNTVNVTGRPLQSTGTSVEMLSAESTNGIPDFEAEYYMQIGSR